MHWRITTERPRSWSEYSCAVIDRALDSVVDLAAHPLGDPAYGERCRQQLHDDGALLLGGFLRADVVAQLVAEADRQHHLAFYSEQTYNVYLDPPDLSKPENDARSLAIVGSKGAVTTDQVASDSALRALYDSATFRSFLCEVLGEDELYEYADPLSSINVNYYDESLELGWHFDNSSFSVTLLLQEPKAGGVFEFVPNMRDTTTGFQNEVGVAAQLEGRGDGALLQLDQTAGDLVLFRGRDALHHVTPVEGDRTRLLVVLAYNTEPGLSLSENARMTFFGRLS